jgi:Ni,Fe-hydrogenase III large subunit
LLYNGQALSLLEIPVLTITDFRTELIEHVQKGSRVASFFGMPDTNVISLIAVLANAAQGHLEIFRTTVQDSYPSLTPEIPQVHWFEREIYEQWNILPLGHPWLKPIRFQPPFANKQSDNETDKKPIQPGVTDYFRVEGDEIHEVAVGPVHAGIIEPGHFRFQCQGENVLHLEIELGYQHRGIEAALAKGLNKRTLHYMETLAGDTTIGHSTAFAMNLEALTGVIPPYRAQLIRAIALELERIANHTGDLGALANDVGFLPTASFCGRLRGDFLNLTAAICGNRFGRNILYPGGVRTDLSVQTIALMQEQLPKLLDSVNDAVTLLWQTPTVMARFEVTGIISSEDIINLGIVGMPARAGNVRQDVRCDYPWGAYMFLESPSVTMTDGDVYARASVRWFEIQNSVGIILKALEALTPGPVQEKVKELGADKLAVSLVEGWRGEICHVAITDAQGNLKKYKVTDPSFHNWFGLALALRNQQISDFPLCNKSFNLSYCGHDL